MVDGDAPSAAGEIALDRGTADDLDLAVGDEVTLLTLAGPQEATVVATTAAGESDSLDSGGTISIAADSAFEWLNSGQVEYEDILVIGAAEPDAVVDAIEPLVPEGYQVQSGDDFRDDLRQEAGGFGKVLKQALQGFALLALFVGGFVIYNTFNVIVAQRIRELAVLAAIGATPRQIKRSLRFEGLAIGLLGSVLGVVVGLGLSFALMAVLSAFGVSLPGSGLVISPTVVISGVIAGTVITYLSVTIPARRAARTEPIEALRDAAVEQTSVSTERKLVIGALAAVGVLGMVKGNAQGVAISALVAFVAVILAGPLIAVVGSRVFRGALQRLGLEGRLAADNVARNPQRTATTANALLIGVFLVTLVTVAGTSVKDFAVEQINELSSADFTITSDGGSVDPDLVGEIEAIDDVVTVEPFRREAVSLEGQPSALSTGDLDALDEVADLNVADGDAADLGPGKVLLGGFDSEALTAVGEEVAVGDTVTVTSSAGDSIDLEVVGVLEASIDTAQAGSFVDEETFDGFVGDVAPTMAFIDVRSGAQSDVEDEIEAVTDLRPDITLAAGNEVGKLFANIFDFLINAVNGLLLMSVAVAVIGIVNTLSLSIIERRRELGLLRAVGMVDRRVQRMVRLESVLISLLGTLTGVLFGLGSGWALVFAVNRSAETDLSYSLPLLQLVVVLVLGVVLGYLASLIPARRSTRLDVLDAINAT
ncbi:MAG: FtsX-like permease family protein [Acidimicrobiales bacterium]|nr:FtsX-like permease family protein [Acidimicrobiales bacterium]